MGGTVALASLGREIPAFMASCREFEELLDEGDFVGDAFGRSIELCLSDRAEGFNALERGVGRSEVSETAHRTEQPLECGMVAFDPVVQMLPRHMANSILWAEAVIDLGNHLDIGRGLVGDDRQGLIEPHRLPRLTQERSGSLGIPPRRQAEVDELPELIDRAPEIAPAAVHPDVGLIHVPGQTAPRSMAAQGALADLGPELAHPAIDRGCIHHDPALGQHVAHIAVGKRVAAIPALRQQDHILREPMTPERITTRHHTTPLQPIAANTCPPKSANATVPLRRPACGI